MTDASTIGAAQIVPFLDLSTLHAGLKDAILTDVSQLIDTGAFTNGPQVAEFEEAFAHYCGTEHCIGMASGLDALRLALIAAGLEPGDEVIVPALTFVATFEAVSQAGGVPVPVDISPHDYCLDPRGVDAAVGLRTRFILPVHLYGQLADMHALQAIGNRNNVLILEDACQAHGAERDGQRAGAGGIAGAFSFYPAKNLGAMGDAGAVTTNDARLAADLRALREHGQEQKYEHRREGWTARLDTIQALVLRHKLLFLDEWNRQRSAAARRYIESLGDLEGIQVPTVPSGSNPAWHLFVIRTDRPEALAAHLDERGIRTGRHYPEPPHRSEAYGYLEGEFPVAEAVASECLSLPLFPGISEAQLEHVISSVRDFF